MIGSNNKLIINIFVAQCSKPHLSLSRVKSKKNNLFIDSDTENR